MIKKALALLVLGLAVGVSAPPGLPVRAQGDEEVHMPPLDQIPFGWHIMRPGGQTACARGSPYSFLVYRGRTNRLLIYFQGGGACWDDITCRNIHNYDGSVDLVNSNDNPARMGDGFGIFDMDNPANPFLDYTIVYIPYCTADMHIGHNIMDYGSASEPYLFQHRGAPNASDVLDWVYANIPQPDSVFVAGCSAGGIGAAFHAPFIISHYPGVPTVVLADSAGGYRGDLSAPFTAWRTPNLLPGWIPGLAGATPQNLTFARLFTAAASAYPSVIFAQFNSTDDMTQTYYVRLGINNTDPIRDTLRANLLEIHASAPNFYSFTMEGDIHCLLPREELYDFARAGNEFLAWLDALAEGRPVPNVYPPGFF